MENRRNVMIENRDIRRYVLRRLRRIHRFQWFYWFVGTSKTNETEGIGRRALRTTLIPRIPRFSSVLPVRWSEIGRHGITIVNADFNRFIFKKRKRVERTVELNIPIRFGFTGFL